LLNLFLKGFAIAFYFGFVFLFLFMTEREKNKKKVIVSIVVPTLNEENFVADSLKALLRQSVPKEKYEIIVSDSSSTDNTREIAKKFADKVVKCERIGAGFGRNFGASFAKGEFLAFVDADTLVGERYIEGVMEVLKKSIAATGPMSPLEKDSMSMKLGFWFADSLVQLTILLNCPLIPGFNFAVRKKAFEESGGFFRDNRTLEDFDLSLRLKKFGRFGFNKKMTVHSSTRRVKEQGFKRYVGNAVKFFVFGKPEKWSEYRKDFLEKKKK